MARKHRKSHRRQKGGAFAIGVGSNAIQTASGAPLEARLSMADGAPLDRVAPAIGNPGGVLSMMGGRRKTATRRRRQKGGACPCMGLQTGGGGSGTGGYGFVLNNELGKVHADITRGSCVLPQRGGAFAPVGVSEANGQVISHPAGYGFGPASAVTVNNGSATYLEAIRYARGGRRRRSHKKQKHSRRQKQSRKH